MDMKEFISDFKEMIKTKDMTKINEKYLKPAMEKSKEAAACTKDMLARYTPIVIDAAKKGFGKANEVVHAQMKKDKATHDAASPENTTQSHTTMAENTTTENVNPTIKTETSETRKTNSTTPNEPPTNI